MDNAHVPPASANVQNNEVEIDLIGLLYELLDKIKYIILATLFGAIIAGGYSYFIAKPVYETTSKLYVFNSEDSVVNLSDLQMGNYLAADYTELFKTWEVDEMVKSNLSLPYSYGKLKSMVKIENPVDTRVLYISVQSTDPKEAVIIANEYAKVLSEFVEEIMETNRPNTLSVALEPTSPISPNKPKNVILGILVGMVLAIGIITVRFITNDAIHSADEITRYTGLPVLGIIPIQLDSEEKNSKKKRGRKN